MKTAPIPDHETQRLQALRELLILDTPPEARFDRIVAFAAQEFDMPIVLVSLVDHNRQWFKARVGLQVCETGRDVSFCGHAVAEHEMLVIENALADPRFADNPLVVGPPHIRFYAGAQLTMRPNLSVGTLCLIDTRPRHLDRTDLSILGSLRDLVVQELATHPAHPALS